MSICVAKIKRVVGRPPKLILMHFREKVSAERAIVRTSSLSWLVFWS
nr:MAG TPA: hypothetical protein [Caudoviricetes sp.]